MQNLVHTVEHTKAAYGNGSVQSRAMPEKCSTQRRNSHHSALLTAVSYAAVPYIARTHNLEYICTHCWTHYPVVVSTLVRAKHDCVRSLVIKTVLQSNHTNIMIHTNRIRAAYPFTIITTNSIPMTAFQVNHRRTPSSACSWNGIRGNGFLLASFYSCPRNNGIKASKEAPCTDHKHLNHPVISSFFHSPLEKSAAPFILAFWWQNDFRYDK